MSFSRPTLIRITDCSTGLTHQGRAVVLIQGCRVGLESETFAQRFYGEAPGDSADKTLLLQGLIKRGLYMPFNVPWPTERMPFNPRPFVGEYAFACSRVRSMDNYPSVRETVFIARPVTENVCHGCLKAGARAAEDGLCFTCFISLMRWAGAREEQFTGVRGEGRRAYLVASPVAVDQWLEERDRGFIVIDSLTGLTP